MGFSNIDPLGMTRLELYRGYRQLLIDLYSVENFSERMLAFLLNRGAQINKGRNLKLEDFRLLWRFLMAAVVRETPTRRKLVLATFASVLWKRPSAFKEAGSFLLAYLSLVRYVESLAVRLDQSIEEIEKEISSAA
jgi:hypothetical protein